MNQSAFPQSEYPQVNPGYCWTDQPAQCECDVYFPAYGPYLQSNFLCHAYFFTHFRINPHLHPSPHWCFTYPTLIFPDSKTVSDQQAGLREFRQWAATWKTLQDSSEKPLICKVALFWLCWKAFIVPETKKWHFSKITFLWTQTYAHIKSFKPLAEPRRLMRSLVFIIVRGEGTRSSQWNQTHLMWDWSTENHWLSTSSPVQGFTTTLKEKYD